MATMSMSAIRKAFGAAEVIKGVDMDVHDEEFVALVGPSGCGKSTLLRLIAGLERVTAGDILIDGRRVNDLSPKDRDIAMVFQNYALYPHMTVSRNMGFSLRMRRLPPAAIDEKVADAAEILGLAHLLERYPGQLSGGQRQRVAMGRAIVRDPKLFLFDEPLSNLDAKLRLQMRAEIKLMHERLRSTTVYVTHDQIEAMTMASRIVVMQNGQIEQMGAPLELYDRPANSFVASFLGSPSMNLISGRLSGGDAPAVVTEDGERLPLPKAPDAPPDARVLFGVRPEHLKMDADGIQVRLNVVEPTGPDTLAHAALGRQSVVILFRERLDLHPGETIGVHADPAHIHLFDAVSGQRIW